MKIVIEFYRTRWQDDARAILGREMDEAADVEGAIRIARSLSRTLSMPQRPDAVSIADIDGNEIYSGRLDAASF
ncbi:hypothetical protein [Kumtagia ephedrae]|jgi:hypothetical protein|uniref:Uncharacterized protein n=1 Tax=Kumtagia ephedrae TaxID=2116701 RepID=A0A2P7S2R7_9HYPH|nr:hypothetical protein [Mesorhizobium ephedrae]PSJ56752.1 hypothetical protein C7I84_19810 [Mesorhizobium ephedrae]